MVISNLTKRTSAVRPRPWSVWHEWAFLLFLLITGNSVAQEPALPKTVGPHSLNVSVNEVEITFHASDAHKLPVRDLKADEVDVFDNDGGPGKVISMKHLGDRPVHVAFVIDTSGSVSGQVSRSRSEAQEAVQRLLLHADDAGTAIAFARSRRVVQTWTNQRAELAANISQIGKGPRDPIDGTNVFDTLFSTCFHEFGQVASTAAANVILLFSDGEDTASYMTVRTAVDRCRESHTVVYAFQPQTRVRVEFLRPISASADQ